jgi:hypothetical protein
VPDPTAVTTPPLVIVATVVVEDTQGFVVAAVGLPVSVNVPFIQIGVLPVMVGRGLTVIVTAF